MVAADSCAAYRIIIQNVNTRHTTHDQLSYNANSHTTVLTIRRRQVLIIVQQNLYFSHNVKMNRASFLTSHSCIPGIFLLRVQPAHMLHDFRLNSTKTSKFSH